MQKFIRSFALLAVVTFAVAPVLRADQTGCNPHPQVATASSNSFVFFVYTVMSYLGA